MQLWSPVSFSNKDFSSKLKLESSPAASDVNLLLPRTHSSNEDASRTRALVHTWSNGELRFVIGNDGITLYGHCQTPILGFCVQHY